MTSPASFSPGFAEPPTITGEIGLTSRRRPPRTSRLRRPTVAVIVAAAIATAPTVVAAPASADALGGPAPVTLQQTASSSPRASSGKNGSASDLDVAPNWSAPGIRQGKELIGWAKAGAIIFGVLGLMGGVVLSKVLKESGNHHASGVRTTAMGVGGALVLAGAAPEIVPWLMG
jgi:hypothetical protein